MIARLSRLAQQLSPRWWAAYGLYAVIALVGTYLWSPGILPFTIAWVVTSVAVAVASAPQPPTRHRRKQPGTKHLAE